MTALTALQSDFVYIVVKALVTPSMNKIAIFERYTVAPCPSRDYYGIKIFNDEVILYLWKVSYGPHLLPVIRAIKFPEFNDDKLLKDEIKQVFGTTVLKYLELVSNEGAKSLVTLPKSVTEKLIEFLGINDVGNLICLSHISKEIFNTNDIWKILYKRLKGLSKLSDMEKDIGYNQGFKTLAKDYQLRNVTKRNLKTLDNKLMHQQKMIVKPAEITRSVSANATKSVQNDIKVLPKIQSIDGTLKKLTKSLKPMSSGFKGKNLEVPRRNMEKKSAMTEKALRLPIEETNLNSDTKQRGKFNKYQFVNENKETTELILPKEYLAMLGSQGNHFDEFVKEKNMSLHTSKDILTKHSKHPVAELKPQQKDKTVNRKSAKESKSETSSNIGYQNLITTAKTDDPNESGMSYLMKKYLASSAEMAKKLNEKDGFAQSSKTTQADFKEKSGNRLVKKLSKNMHQGERPISRKTGSSVNALTKLTTLKKK